MTDQLVLARRTEFLGFLADHEPDSRVQIFQILDTVWEVYLHYHQIPSLDQLAIPATLVKDIPYINGFLSSSPPALLGQELTALHPLRPRSISALPALARKLPTLQGLPSGLLDHQHTYNLVDNLEHAKALEAELWAQNNKKGTAKGSDAHNFPEDKASQQRLKNELFFAIINCNTIIEKPGNPQVKKIQGLTNLELEIMAWKVLEAIKNAQDGIIGIPGSTTAYEAFPTFADRFDAVKDAILHSKCIVGSMLQVNFTKRLAANPNRELELKVRNKELNSIKTAQNKAGQTALMTGDASKEGDGSYKYRTGEQLAPAPRQPTMVEESILARKRRRRSPDKDEQSEADGDTIKEYGASYKDKIDEQSTPAPLEPAMVEEGISAKKRRRQNSDEHE